MTLFFVALLVVPIVFLSVTLVDEVPPLVDAAKDLFAHGLPLAPAWLADLPIVGETATARWNALAQDTQALGATLRPWIGKGGELLLGLGAHFGSTVLQLLVSLLVAFFLYRDGAPLVRNLTAIVERVGGTRGPKLLLRCRQHDASSGLRHSRRGHRAGIARDLRTLAHRHPRVAFPRRGRRLPRAHSRRLDQPATARRLGLAFLPGAKRLGNIPGSCGP